MKTDVKVYAFVEDDADVLSILDENNYDYTLIHDYEQLKGSINSISYLSSHVLILDIKYIFSADNNIKKEIKKDLMREWLAIICYSEEQVIPIMSKSKLYRLDFRAIMDKSNQLAHQKIFSHVINYANLNMETLQNNFIRALLHYNDLDIVLRDAKYLIDYLTYYFNLSKQDAADVLLVVSSLIAAFKTGTLTKTAEVLYTIFKSIEVNVLYKNYMQPKTFLEQLVSSILYVVDDQKSSNIFLSKMDMTAIDKDVIEIIDKFYDEKNIIATSYIEIDKYWEQIYLKLFGKYKNDDFGILDHYLKVVYQVLMRSMVRSGYLHTKIEIDENVGVNVSIELLDVNEKSLQKCTDKVMINKDLMQIIVDADKQTIQVKLKLSQQKKKVAKTVINHTLDKSQLESMHYKDEEKISAEEFLKDFEIDTHMLEDLKDNEIDLNDALFLQEELDDETLQAVSKILDKYVSIFHETIEFDDIATSLDGLSRLFKRLSISMIDKNKLEMLRFYIQGLINDLSTWKRYIFIEPNTPDIHYLDASLLENCATIEHYIFSDTTDEESVEEDDNGLEFF